MHERWEDWFQEGEQLLWEGAPMKGQFSWLRNVVMSAFGVPFLGGGLVSSGSGFMMLVGSDFGIAKAATGLFLFCFGIPFLCVGTALAFGPWYADLRAHEMVRYALTDHRGYVATRWWKRKIEIFRILPDQPVTVEDGRSVFFHTTIGTDSDGDRTTDRKGFENIADADRVYKLIRSIQAGDTPRLS